MQELCGCTRGVAEHCRIVKLELSSWIEQLQRAQGLLQMMGGSQQLEDVRMRLKRRSEAITMALRVRCRCPRSLVCEATMVYAST